MSEPAPESQLWELLRGALSTRALAIVAELAERWGGSVELLDGPGTRVRARFQAPATDSSPPPNPS